MRNPAKFGQVNHLITQAKNFGDFKNTYNGVDMAVSARFGKGGLLSDGDAVGRIRLLEFSN